MAKLKEKIVLTYSGDLDTTVIIPWLREYFDYEVTYCCVDCSQDNELSDLEERAKPASASELYLFGENDSFAGDYILPCLQAGLDTEQATLPGDMLSHPLIAQKFVELARKEHAVVIYHGAAGKGNDQVRFKPSAKILALEPRVITPQRTTRLWPFYSREDELAYCRQEDTDLLFDASHTYSHDRNLRRSPHEGLKLEGPIQEPVLEELLRLGVSPKRAPDTETSLRIGFEEGVPVSLDGGHMKFSDLLRKLNEIGDKSGIGIFDIVEDRVAGMKARGIYETPGVVILLEAKRSLGALVFDGDTFATRHPLGEKYASLLYASKWLTPLCETLWVFSTSTQSTASDEVKPHLHKGNLTRADASSVFSLYTEDVASFTTGPLYRHRNADGFIVLFGLPLELRAKMLQHAGVAEKESALAELPTLLLPVKTTVSEIKKVDRKQAVGKVTEKKKSDERTPEKKEAVKKETAKKTAEKKTSVKKVTRKILRKAPEKK